MKEGRPRVFSEPQSTARKVATAFWRRRRPVAGCQSGRTFSVLDRASRRAGNVALHGRFQTDSPRRCRRGDSPCIPRRVESLYALTMHVIHLSPSANSATTIHAAIDSNVFRGAPPRATIWFGSNCSSQKRAVRFVTNARQMAIAPARLFSPSLPAREPCCGISRDGVG